MGALTSSEPPGLFQYKCCGGKTGQIGFFSSSDVFSTQGVYKFPGKTAKRLLATCGFGVNTASSLVGVTFYLLFMLPFN